MIIVILRAEFCVLFAFNPSACRFFYLSLMFNSYLGGFILFAIDRDARRAYKCMVMLDVGRFFGRDRARCLSLILLYDNAHR